MPYTKGASWERPWNADCSLPCLGHGPEGSRQEVHRSAPGRHPTSRAGLSTAEFEQSCADQPDSHRDLGRQSAQYRPEDGAQLGLGDPQDARRLRRPSGRSTRLVTQAPGYLSRSTMTAWIYIPVPPSHRARTRRPRSWPASGCPPPVPPGTRPVVWARVVRSRRIRNPLVGTRGIEDERDQRLRRLLRRRIGVRAASRSRLDCRGACLEPLAGPWPWCEVALWSIRTSRSRRSPCAETPTRRSSTISVSNQAQPCSASINLILQHDSSLQVEALERSA